MFTSFPEVERGPLIGPISAEYRFTPTLHTSLTPLIHACTLFSIPRQVCWAWMHDNVSTHVWK